MSSNYSYSYSSFSSASFTTNAGNGETTHKSGHRNAKRAHRDEHGNTTVQSLSQHLGEDPVVEERRYDSTGRQLIDGNLGSRGMGQGRIEDVGDGDKRH